jgi:hypothetical protein
VFRLFKSFDWKNSKAHLLLLSKFIRGQEMNYFLKWGNWVKVLNEPPEKAIKRFIDEGMLINAGLDTIVSYKYKVTELKDLLKQRRLGVSGTKDELVQRLIQADKEGMMKLVAGTELLTCTQTGREIAELYIASEREKRTKVEQQVIDYLTKRMFKEASLAVAKYEAEQVFPRGIGIDWKHYNPKREIEILNSIFNNKPEILSKLEDDKLEPLRIGAAMMELGGENTASKWLPPNFETGLSIDNDSAARMLLFNSQHKETLKQYGESGAVQYVEILATPNSCESCKKLQGKRYKLSEAPKLPNPNCTHELGCRCVYLPCVD